MTKETDGTRVLALRRPVPGARTGDHTCFGVFIPPGLKFDASDALRALTVLAPTDAWIQQLSEAAIRSPGPVLIDPVPVSELGAGSPPTATECATEHVVRLIACLLRWWDSPDRGGCAVLAHESSQIEGCLAAALPALPRALVSALTFSTLEPRMIPDLAMCGLIPTLDSEQPGEEVLTVDLREPPGLRVGDDLDKWQQAARSLLEAKGRQWIDDAYKGASSAPVLIRRIGEIDTILVNPDAASQSIMRTWLLADAEELHRVSPANRAQLALVFPSDYSIEALVASLADQEFAAPFWAGLGGSLAAFDDSRLAAVLGRADTHVRRQVAHAMMEASAREALHPECRSAACPAVALFDAVIQTDDRLLSESLRLGLNPPNLSGSVLARAALLGSAPGGSQEVTPTAHQLALAALALLPRTDPSVLADKFRSQPKWVDSAEILAKNPAGYTFLIDQVLPQAQLVPEDELPILFGPGSDAYRRHCLPDEIALYAGPASSLTLYTDPLLGVNELGNLGLSADHADLLAARMVAAGRSPFVVLLAQQAAVRRNSYLSPHESPPALSLDKLMTDQLMADLEGADLLLGRLLPAVEPAAANLVLKRLIPRLVDVYGLGREFPGFARVLPPPQPVVETRSRVRAASEGGHVRRPPEPDPAQPHPVMDQHSASAQEVAPVARKRARHPYRHRGLVGLLAASIIIAIFAVLLIVWSPWNGGPAAAPSRAPSSSSLGADSPELPSSSTLRGGE